MRNAFVLVVGTVALSGCAAIASPAASPESKDESSPDHLEAVGNAAAGYGDMTRAEEYFMAALHKGGDERRLTLKTVSVCIADGRLLLARAHASEFVRKRPRDSEMRQLLAALEYAAGHPEIAITHYERVLRERPLAPDAHYALAALLRNERNDAASAATHFRAYLELAPDGPFAEPARAALAEASP